MHRKRKTKRRKQKFVRIIHATIMGVWKIIPSIFRFAKNTMGHFLQYSSNRIHKYNIPDKPVAYRVYTDAATVEGSIGQFTDWLHHSSSWVSLILGQRGSGKTALALRIMENDFALNQSRQFAMGISASQLPRWITAVKSPQSLPQGAVLLVDEAGISFNARRSMQERHQALGELLLLARHNDFRILFCAQSSANIDVNIMRQVDALMFKSMGFLQCQFERPKIVAMYEKLQQSIQHLANNSCYMPHNTMVLCNHFQGSFHADLPGFWHQGVSKNLVGHQTRTLTNSIN